MSVLLERLRERIKQFCSVNKPSCDPSCIEKFNNIQWQINYYYDSDKDDDGEENDEMEEGVNGFYQVEDGGTWTEPFGTKLNYMKWIVKLSKYISEIENSKFNIWLTHSNNRMYYIIIRYNLD